MCERVCCRLRKEKERPARPALRHDFMVVAFSQLFVAIRNDLNYLLAMVFVSGNDSGLEALLYSQW